MSKTITIKYNINALINNEQQEPKSLTDAKVESFVSVNTGTIGQKPINSCNTSETKGLTAIVGREPKKNQINNSTRQTLSLKK